MSEDNDDIQVDVDEDAEDDEFEAALEDPDLAEEDLVDEDFELVDEEEAFGEDETLDDSVLVVDEIEEDADARPRPVRDEKEDEDDEEVDPDDVEEDLDTILKDRLEAYDEDAEDDEEEDVAPAAPTDESDVPQKREGEFPCPGCFLLVSAKQVKRSPYCPHCGDPIQVPADIV